MTEITTLIKDIQALVLRKDGWFDATMSSQLSNNLGLRLGDHFNAQRYAAGRATLRLSGMGARCPKALWYSIHHPELAEPLPPWAEVKFSFGHILEALVIALAKAAGHEVTGEQDELRLDGIVGHRDCVIDGYTVDVKSASSIAFKKFQGKNFDQADSFGYLDQLDGYVVAAREDPLVRYKDIGYILAIDKQLGHMCLYEHFVRERSIRDRIAESRRIVELQTPPPCECRTIPEGASGNIRLDVKASYSPYKWCCHPFLRCFLYASGPVYLTQVIRKPDVSEINREGKRIY